MPVLVLWHGAPMLDEGPAPTPAPEEETETGGTGPIGGRPMLRRRFPMIDLELWEYAHRREEEEYMLIK